MRWGVPGIRVPRAAPPVGSTAGDLLDALDRAEVSEKTLAAIDAVVEARRQDPVRVPVW
ncbi:MAG: hypothetical protein ACK5LS_14155 [Propioniciclava sp.]